MYMYVMSQDPTEKHVSEVGVLNKILLLDILHKYSTNQLISSPHLGTISIDYF